MPASRAACVMGWPVAHSRSPLIHGYWLQRYGIAGDYRREPVRPEDFPAFLASLADRGYVGGNVTIPLKEIAFARSAPDEAARAVGAANTVWFEGGELRSTNSDVGGFLASLDESVPDWATRSGGRTCVLGAGGAARAVIFALLSRGIETIELVNRSAAKAEALAAAFGPAVRPRGLGELPAAMAGAGLFVNASPLGMAGHEDFTPELGRLGADAVVSDLVYVPLKTPLIRAAEAAGIDAVGGLGMLLHQAGKGFELWFSVRPEVTEELRALVEGEILAGEARSKQAETAR